MNTAPRILGNHAKFFPNARAFTLPAPGTAGVDDLPGDTDPAWTDLGILSEVTVEPKIEERPVWAPSPGRLRKKKVLETKDELTITLRCEELSKLGIQALFRTEEIVAATSKYQPLGGKTLEGWLLYTVYDQDDALFLTTRVWCRLKANGPITAGDDIARIEYVADVLDNDLNEIEKPVET